MNCPKCGREMQEGFLQGCSNGACFNRELQEHFVNTGEPEDVKLTQAIFRAPDYAGFICKACGLIVIDYKNAILHW